MIFFADVLSHSVKGYDLRRLAEEKLGFNFELGQLVRYRARRSRRDTKDGVTIVPGADGVEKAGAESVETQAAVGRGHRSSPRRNFGK